MTRADFATRKRRAIRSKQEAFHKRFQWLWHAENKRVGRL